jgi:uncharacterized glyoxalase superfamily protein PhnB
MKPTPPGWPRCSASLHCEAPRAEIDWLVRAFGFEVKILVDGEGGKVAHSELTFGDAVIMVGHAGKDGTVSPKQAGGPTGAHFLYVDDADAHHARATAAGATIVRPLATVDYGPEHWSDRGYSCTDPEGHLWHFAHRVR